MAPSHRSKEPGGCVPVDESGRYAPPGASSPGPPEPPEHTQPERKRTRALPVRWVVAGLAVLAALTTPLVLSQLGSGADTDQMSPLVAPSATTSPSPNRVDAAGPDEEHPVASPSPESPRSGAAADLPEGIDTVVESIVDGDTIYVTALEVRVRLIGINTPETRHPNKGVECFGHEATEHITSLVPPGTTVRVVFDVEREDRYGRPLGYIYRLDDGVFVNLRMVEDGYGQVATYPPNVRHAEEFVAAQQEAREAGHGLWDSCSS